MPFVAMTRQGAGGSLDDPRDHDGTRECADAEERDRPCPERLADEGDEHERDSELRSPCQPGEERPRR